MKRFLGMPVALLDDAPSSDGVLRCATVDQLQQARQIRLQARAEAARILRDARRWRDGAHREAEVIRNAARLQAAKEGEAIAMQARTQAVSDALEWLVTSADLERTIAQQLEARLRELVVQAVSALLGQCDSGTLLAQRIASRMSQMDLVEPVELHVGVPARDSVSALFAGMPNVSVVADPALGEHQAMLRTRLVTIRFDLRQQLDQVLASLRRLSPTESD